MTIKSRLTAALLIVIVFSSLLGLGALFVQEKLGKSIEDLEIQSKKVALLADLQLATEKLLMPANDYIITAKPSYKEDFANQAQEVETLFTTMGQSQFFNKKEAAQIEAAKALFNAVKQSAEQIFGHDARDPQQAAWMEEMDYKYADPMIKQLNALSNDIRGTFTKTQNDARDLRHVSRISIIAAVSLLTIILVIAGFFQLRKIGKSLNAVTNGLKEIADGNGDLTKRISFHTKDELGMLSRWFNSFAEHLQGMMKEVKAASASVSSSAHHIAGASENVHRFANIQFNAIAGTSQATERLNESIRGIANDAENLLGLSAQASSSSGEISASISNVADLTENLDRIADTTLSAVNQLTVSFREVSANVLELTEKAEHVVSSAVEINAVAGEINAYAHEQAASAEEIKNEAFSIGLETVKKTKERMEKIRTEVASTAKVMGELGDMSNEISRIVGMIGEITNQTKMLALNASILAAQSGSEGKGFSVVADEVKALAAKTAVSTEEIANMIQHVQERTAGAIEAAQRSTDEAEEGVRLSLEAETVLGTIIGKTEGSLHNAMKVARAAEEQTSGLKLVTEAIQQIQFMISRINAAVTEQKKASHDILGASEGVHGYAREVRVTITSQADEALSIAEMLQEIHSRLTTIADSTTEQQKASAEIVYALETVNVKAEESIKLATSLDAVVEELHGQADLLSAKVGKFTV